MSLFYLFTSSCGSFNFETNQNLENVNVQIEQGIISEVKINYDQTISKENLQKAQFLNKNIGWVISKTELFKTEDGGNSWKQIKLDIPEQATIKDVYFINQDVGWIVEQDNEITSNPITNEYHFWILKTDDGGKSWQRQYEKADIRIFQIYFTDENNGWVIGEKYIKSPNWNRLALVLRTTNQGVTWTDVSEDVNKTLVQSFGGVNEQVRSILAKNSKEVILLTSKRKIFSSSNNGESWTFEREIPFEKNRKVKIGNDEFSSDLGFSALKLGQNGNDLFRIVGNLYDESFHTIHLRGELSIEKERNLWINFIFNEFKIDDAEFLSEKIILVCGFWTEQNQLGGAILYSSNKGYSWKTLYRNTGTENLHSLVVLSSNQVLAVGEKGRIVKFEIQR